MLADTAETVFDREASQAQPSFQPVGRPDRASISLADLQDLGVVLTGRLTGIAESLAGFDDSLLSSAVAADAKLAKLLQRIDRFIDDSGDDATAPSPGFTPHWPRYATATPPLQLDLEAAGIRTILWAIGYRREYPWLEVPGALDARGEIRHNRGVCPTPGLYAIGLPFLQRRNSAFIDGVGHDAVTLAAHMVHHLDRSTGALV